MYDDIFRLLPVSGALRNSLSLSAASIGLSSVCVVLHSESTVTDCASIGCVFVFLALQAGWNSFHSKNFLWNHLARGRLPYFQGFYHFVFPVFLAFIAFWLVRRLHNIYTTYGARLLFFYEWCGDSILKKRTGRLLVRLQRRHCELRQLNSLGILTHVLAWNVL